MDFSFPECEPNWTEGKLEQGNNSSTDLDQIKPTIDWCERPATLVHVTVSSVH